MTRRGFLAAAALGLAATAAGCTLGPVTITGPLSFTAPITGDRVDVLRAHLEEIYGSEPACDPMAFAVFREGTWVFPTSREEFEQDGTFLLHEGEEVLFWPAAADPPFDYA